MVVGVKVVCVYLELRNNKTKLVYSDNWCKCEKCPPTLSLTDVYDV